MNSEVTILQNDAIELLKELIATPSFSKEEDQTASIIGKFLRWEYRQQEWVIIFALNKHFDASQRSCLIHITIP